MDNSQSLRHIIREAESFIVTAGAGMGVDSGLPDFRGSEGFWDAYPPFKRLGLSFSDLANPRWFREDPYLAWGFYGHRLDLYRKTRPHVGFQVLLDHLRDRPHWVFTSNVDGQFQRAGFSQDRIVEIHGSIHHLQCSRPCSSDIWSASSLTTKFNEQEFRWNGQLPVCESCDSVSRPNILMFGDGDFLDARVDGQILRYTNWLEHVDLERLVVIEVGAGTAVPTIRLHSERLQQRGAVLVRINPREAFGPHGTIEVAASGESGIQQIFGH